MEEMKAQNEQERKMQERLNMRKIYSNLSSLDSAVQYMKSEDFEKGGWFLLAFQATEIQKMRKDLESLREMVCALCGATYPAPKSSINHEPWVDLYQACWEFQKESMEGNFELVFNPSKIAVWIREARNEFFAECVTSKPGLEKYKYQIKKDLFLDALLKYREFVGNNHNHKFAISTLRQFTKWRKDKSKERQLPRMCA